MIETLGFASLEELKDFLIIGLLVVMVISNLKGSIFARLLNIISVLRTGKHIPIKVDTTTKDFSEALRSHDEGNKADFARIDTKISRGFETIELEMKAQEDIIKDLKKARAEDREKIDEIGKQIASLKGYMKGKESSL